MKRTLILLGLSLLVIACGGKKDGASDTKDTSAARSKDASGSTTSTTASEGSTGAKKMYDVKSGIVEMKNSMMDGMKQTMYFDDYGAKQATYISMEMMGQKSENVQIVSDGWTMSYDAQKKEGTKMKVPASATSGAGSMAPNPADLTDEQKKQYNYKELESRQIMGKDTKGYSMSMSGMDIKAWTWNNVPLYLEMGTGQGKSITIEATSIQTDVDVPAEKFKVPDDVKMKEVDMSAPVTPPTPTP